MVGLFSTASKESQIGIDFLRDGVAVAQISAASKNPGSLVRAEFIEAISQDAQVEALRPAAHGETLVDLYDQLAKVRSSLEAARAQ